MTRDEFDALVKRLEAESLKHPRLFLANTIALVFGAYLYLLLVLVLSLAACALFAFLIFYKPNAATIKLGILMLCLFGGMFWAIVKGLWVRLEAPEGLRIERSDAPELFALLDELRNGLQCKPFHEVLLVGDLNAAVVQVPRLGIFGWHKNYLLLGLPLMQGLGPDEFRAVLAHEFAHSSGGHGRFGNWLYRLRRSWTRVVEEIARQQNKGIKVMIVFLKFFWPRFSARSFVLSRANEYEADRCAVRFSNQDAAARALMRVDLNSRLLEDKFWPDLFQRAISEADAPSEIYRGMAHALRSGPRGDDLSKWLRQAFVRETDSGDTHPCLKDRLAAIGFTGDQNVLRPIAGTAAEKFLGANVEKFEQALSEQWRTHVDPIWKKRHEEAKKSAAELASMDEGSEEKDAGKLWKKATAIIDLKGDDAAREIVDQVLAIDPKHAAALFVRGRQLLENDDPSGVDSIEAALVEDPFLTEAGINLLYGFFKRTGARERLRPLEDRMEQFEELKAKASQERNQLTVIDTFLPSELDEAALVALRKIFEGEEEIGSAAVVQKQLEIFPQLKLLVICVRIKAAWWKLRSSNANQQLVQQLVDRIQLPGSFLVFVDEENLKGVARNVFAVEGAVFYQVE